MDIKDTSRTTNPSTHGPDEALGDLGGKKTWEPPQGEQGISNRSEDEGSDEVADRPSGRD
jgi:hypothetical protein